MSIATEITRLQNAKEDLKTAINAKTDSSHQITTETIDDYADFVDSIQTGGGGGKIPPEYTQIEYIESNALGYIKLNYKTSEKTQYEVVCQLLNIGSYDGCLFGSRSGANSADEFIFWHNTGTNATTETASPRRGTTYNAQYLTKAYQNSDFDWRKFRLSGYCFYVEDVYFGKPYSATVSTSNLDLCLLSLNNNGSIDTRYYRGRIKYLKILDGVDSALDLLPVRRNADNRVGLYDVVNNVFYDNELSANFIAGPDVE